MSNTNVRIERVYDDPEGATGGFRVFVDRLWPRGESKAKFHYDVWAKDVTPSTALREWYHADRPGRWEEFMKKYRAELASNPDIPQFLAELKPHTEIVLLTAARDVAHSHVPILADFIRGQSER
ncbi:MAG: DUF488 family protein [Muribaculaceae bacterium]|nr:DUF488 family protein [Muribaculaceae bacterium]